jgi:hypothetical protein
MTPPPARALDWNTAFPPAKRIFCCLQKRLTPKLLTQ